MLEHYRSNPYMRKVFFRMNGITHAEIWDSEDNDGYQIALCSREGIGTRESPVFATPGQCIAWVRNTCNCQDLSIEG